MGIGEKMIGLMENTYLIPTINLSIALVSFLLAHRSLKKFQLKRRIGKKYLSILFSFVGLAYFFVFSKNMFPVLELPFWILGVASVFAAIAVTLSLVAAITAEKHLKKVKIAAVTVTAVTFAVAVLFDLQVFAGSGSFITTKISRDAFLFSTNLAIMFGALFFFQIRMLKHRDELPEKKFKQYKARVTLGTLGIMGLWILMYLDFTGILNHIFLPIKALIGVFAIITYWGIAMPNRFKRLFE